MSTRKFRTHTVSHTQPIGGQAGGETTTVYNKCISTGDENAAKL